MKIKRIANSRTALLALGVFLGRGAYADTTLTFNGVPPEQDNFWPVVQSFGDSVSASSPGISVTGFGTPNINLTWQATGAADTTWDYYDDGGSVWSAAQLNNSSVGYRHELAFTPNAAQASAVIKSFNFHPYYDDRFAHYAYRVSVVDSGGSVLSGPVTNAFESDGLPAHPVSINYTGAIGQTIILRLERIDAGPFPPGPHDEGRADSIAVDDIVFAQVPETLLLVGPQVISVSPTHGETGVGAIPRYSATITNRDTTLVTNSIQLKFDGNPVSPPPTIASVGGLTTVSHQGTGLLAPASTHLYTLSYNDHLGSNFTSDVQFTVANYQTLPPAYAIPTDLGAVRGFTHRTVSASLEAGPDPADTLSNTVARAKAQLAGTLINTNTGLPYTNSAAVGPNPDGSFNVDTVLNFGDEYYLYGSGNFTNDAPFPGLPTGPDYTNQSFATESLLFLELPAGYYRLGVNSDDGFETSALPPPEEAGSPVVVGIFDDGRGADDTLFDFLVTAGGLYRFRLIYFEGWGDANCEFFSVNLANNEKILVNDTNANAIASFRVLKPHITSIARSGSDVVIDWNYGSPPFQVQFKTNLTDAVWSDIGSPTMNRTANVPIQPPTGFMRVSGSP